MERFWILVTLIAVLAGCSDVIPEKQCDPDRRCTPEDAPVCGADGQWYECGLVAQCEQVAVTFDEGTCGGRPPGTPLNR